MCARRYGAKLFICDNLMIALTSADEENRAQAKFAAALKAFAVKYKVHVILVNIMATQYSDVLLKHGEPRNLGCLRKAG